MNDIKFQTNYLNKMCSTWNHLEILGWEKLEVFEKGIKRLYYKTPPQNGIKRTIRRSRDLKQSEKKYVNILFPNVNSYKSSVHSETSTTDLDQGPSTAVHGVIFDDLVGEFPIEDGSEETSTFSKKRSKLEKATSNLFAATKNSTVNVSDSVPEYVSKLYELIHTDTGSNMNIEHVTANVLCALGEENNPFKEFPWDTSKNIFCEVLNFGLKHTPDLVRLITNLSKSDTGLTEKSVYKVAFIYSLLVCSASPQNNSSFLKLMTVMLKMSGCTGTHNKIFHNFKLTQIFQLYALICIFLTHSLIHSSS